MLAGLLSDEDVELIDGGIIRDSKADLISAYEAGLAQADIIISSGGASDGIEDHSQQALSDIAAEKLFWRLAMKPGRPMAAAVKRGRLIFCLPGNPVAAFVCFKLLIAPAIDKLSGADIRVPLALKIAAGFTHKKAAGRAEYLRAVIKTSTDGSQKIALHGRKGAGVISSLTGADGLVEIPLDCEQVREGDLLNFIPFQEQVL
jgi:molybdopterin molybdotransferase